MGLGDAFKLLEILAIKNKLSLLEFMCEFIYQPILTYRAN